jgi:hypothetical protein
MDLQALRTPVSRLKIRVSGVQFPPCHATKYQAETSVLFDNFPLSILNLIVAPLAFRFKSSCHKSVPWQLNTI